MLRAFDFAGLAKDDSRYRREAATDLRRALLFARIAAQPAAGGQSAAREVTVIASPAAARCGYQESFPLSSRMGHS